MSAKENPAGQGGVLEETASGAVPGVNSSIADFDFPLTPADEARARAAVHDGVIDADRRATKEMFNQLARRAGNDPRLSQGGVPYARSVADISSIVCDHFLREEQVPMLRRLSPEAVRVGLRGAINDAIEEQNEQLKRDLVVGKKLMHIARLSHAEIARLMAALHRVRRLQADARPDDLDPMVLYVDAPQDPAYGTYTLSVDALEAVTRRYQPDLTTREFAEVVAALKGSVERVRQSDDRDLVACRNGIVDYNGGDPVFREFSPDYVFLAKLAVDWNPDAQNPHITTPDGDEWDVESWMSSLSDDPEIVELLWETTGAVVRPRVSWNKCAFYYSKVGNNGKGSLLSLQRGLVGAGGYQSIPLAQMAHTHGLEPLIGGGSMAAAILTDENPVGTFVDKADVFKALVTHDVLTINPKGKKMLSVRWFGFMIQCFNDKPTIRDKTDSIYRRQLFIPFDKSFTGVERQYIKDEYLRRTDVLEYVLKRVLTMSYYELSEPLAVRRALEEYKEFNDPVRTFWNEVKTQFYWDLVPLQFIFDLFVAWMGRNMPNSKPIGRNKFYDELVTLVQAEPDGAWICRDRSAKHRPGTRMAATEPLIAEYDLLDWANVGARNDPQKFARIPASKLKANYTGLVRREPTDEDFLRGRAEETAAVTEAVAAGDTVDPLTVEALAIPEDGAPGPASRPEASPSDYADDGAPAPDATTDDARPPTRTLSPEHTARLAAMGVLAGTADDNAAEVAR